MIEFKLPEVGENIKSGTVVRISVSIGDKVKKGQDLLELETDKAVIPIPSPTEGVIDQILVKAGEEVKIGQVILKIQDADNPAVGGAGADNEARLRIGEQRGHQERQR